MLRHGNGQPARLEARGNRDGGQIDVADVVGSLGARRAMGRAWRNWHAPGATRIDRSLLPSLPYSDNRIFAHKGRRMADRFALDAELLKACSHPTRLMILNELMNGVKCVNDIEDLLEVRQTNISQHLAVLRHAKLVDYAQDGTLRC